TETLLKHEQPDCHPFFLSAMTADLTATASKQQQTQSSSNLMQSCRAQSGQQRRVRPKLGHGRSHLLNFAIH
ncbi:MAG: hypothetical protein AAFN08_10430, partial [Cyanobacteria bacterium J06559_3]